MNLFIVIAEVEEEYRHPKLNHPSGHSMEFDVYIDLLGIAFEYQGEQHYRPIYWFSSNFAAQQNRDEEKRRACAQASMYYN